MMRCRTLLILLLLINSWSLFAQDTIVLKCGVVSISQYEFDKNLAFFRNAYKQRNKGKESSREETLEWIQTFKNRTYFLADAYSQGYDTTFEVLRWIKATEHYNISTSGGLLDQRLTGTLTDKELDNAFRKNLRRPIVRRVKFKDQETVLSVLRSNMQVDAKRFDSLFENAAKIDGVTAAEEKLEWPFFTRGENEEKIFELRQGEVSMLPLKDGWHLVKLMAFQNTDSIEQPEKLKQSIRERLLFIKRDKARGDFFQEVMNHAGIRVDSQFLKEMTERIERSPVSYIDPDLFAFKGPALFYKHKDADIQVGLDEIAEYYNTLPLRQELNSPDRVHEYLRQMVYDIYAFEKAEAFGITRERRFLGDKDNYRKDLVYVSYERESLKKQILISEDEIAEQYKNDREHFRQAEEAVVSLFFFRDRSDAVHSVYYIEKGIFDGRLLRNIKSMDLHKNVKYGDGSLPDSTLSVLLDLKINQPSRPVNFNNGYLIALKESEKGERVKQLIEVHHLIRAVIEKKKLELVKMERLARLKEKYELTDSIVF